ncbi:transcriptional regulator family: Fungal Specific TF [Paecilomyces variotii]|nr:transcriptional regulator family: Fungal Specific TF [Paecilomyces variotii]
MPDDVPVQSPPPSTSRVGRACERCRRQKLKCDDSRPCIMCVRSGMVCKNQAGPTPRRSRKGPARRARTFASNDVRSQSTPTETRPRCRAGINSSAVGFAVNIFGEHAASHADDISSIPGHPLHSTGSVSEWSLKGMRMPPAPLMLELLDAYFERVHWFICLFYRPRFMDSVRPLLDSAVWKVDDRGPVVTALLLAALGLQCAAQDPNWSGHDTLASSSLQAHALKDDLLAEVRLHLMDLLDDCRIESVQICILLGTFYIYHGSPSLAWNILGLSVRTAYALSLHTDDHDLTFDPITAEIRHRTWNHVTIADTFAAMIFGRPLSLDPAFCGLHQVTQLEDNELLPTTCNDALQDPNVNGLSFFVFRYRLYEIIRSYLYQFRGLNLQNPVSVDAMFRLVETIENARTSLEALKAEVPPALLRRAWTDDDPMINNRSSSSSSSSSQHQRPIDNLSLQGHMLQLTYDSVVMFIHRPLLEYHVAPELRSGIASLMPKIRATINRAFEAALRISKVPATPFESQFCISFLLMHFFSAGVILCLPPTLWPFSAKATESKAGTLRIIRAARKLRLKSQIAKHTEELLTKLVRLCLQQELENALKDDGSPKMAGASSHLQCVHDGDSAPSAPQHQTTTTQDETTAAEQQFFSSNEYNGNFVTGSIPVETDQGFSFNPFWNGQYHQIDDQLDEALGNFGQMLFNLVPNDPYSVWNWGSGNWGGSGLR